MAKKVKLLFHLFALLDQAKLNKEIELESFFYVHRNTWLRADLILFENNLIPEDNN